MARSLLILFAAALVVPMADAAPRPKEKAAVLYYPTEIGTTRVYEVKVGGRLSTLRTEIVTDAREEDGTWTVSTGYVNSDGKRIPLMRVRVSEKGLFLVWNGSFDINPPSLMLRLPVKPGDTWETSPAKPILPATYKVVGEEEVEVPAGKYKSIRVDSRSSHNDREIKDSSWFVPGVGMVRRTGKVGDKDYVEALTSFSPGK